MNEWMQETLGKHMKATSNKMISEYKVYTVNCTSIYEA
jgi:hypothetical protein